MRKSTHPLILRSVLTLTGRLKAAVLSSSVSVESGLELFTCERAAVIAVIAVIVVVVLIEPRHSLKIGPIYWFSTFILLLMITKTHGENHVADCPAVSFRFVYLQNKLISKCKTVELGDQLLYTKPVSLYLNLFCLSPACL